MEILKALLCFLVLGSLVAMANPPNEEEVQGLYEGAWKDAANKASCKDGAITGSIGNKGHRNIWVLEKK